LEYKNMAFGERGGFSSGVDIVVGAGVLRSEQGGRPCIDLVFVGGTDDADVTFGT
jgi:hypothetical protein